MEKQSWKLFPTPVNYFKDVLAPDQLEVILRHCLEAEAGNHGAFTGGTKSSFSKSSRLITELEARYPVLAGLNAGLGKLMKDYAMELGFTDITITNSWFNVQYPGSVLKHHVHPDAKVSAALCILADDKSSKLFLENPNPVLNFVKPDVPVDSMFEFAKFSMASGDLLLFPSWIKHGSGAEANQSDTRVMISINAH